MFKSIIQRAISTSRLALPKAPSTSTAAFSTLRVGQISTFSSVQTFSFQPILASFRSYSTDAEEQQPQIKRRRYPPITTPTLLVRGLPWARHTVEDVKKLFEDLEVSDVTIFEEGGKPTGFVLVHFASVEEARRAMRTAKNLTVDERSIYTRPLNEQEIAALKEDHQKPSTFAVVKKLPFSSSEEEIKQIFSDLKVTGVALSEGSAFVSFATPEDLAKAVEKSGVDFARRKLFINRSTGFDYRKAEANPSRVIKVRGAHSSATEEDLKNFFANFKVVNVTFTTRDSNTGRKIPGDIFVEFSTPDEAAEALKLDRQHMGDRYLQIYRSSKKERRGRLFGFGNKGEQQQQQPQEQDE